MAKHTIQAEAQVETQVEVTNSKEAATMTATENIEAKVNELAAALATATQSQSIVTAAIEAGTQFIVEDDEIESADTTVWYLKDEYNLAVRTEVIERYGRPARLYICDDLAMSFEIQAGTTKMREYGMLAKITGLCIIPQGGRKTSRGNDEAIYFDDIIVKTTKASNEGKKTADGKPIVRLQVPSKKLDAVVKDGRTIHEAKYVDSFRLTMTQKAVILRTVDSRFKKVTVEVPAHVDIAQ